MENDKKRIAFVRSVDIKQAEPSISTIQETLLNPNNIKIKIYYSDGEIDTCKYETEKFNQTEDINILSQKIASWKPDIVISISIPDNNSIRDSILKDILKKDYGITMVMHDVETTMLLSNKWETNFWLRSHKYGAPNAVHIPLEMITQLSDNAKEYSSFKEAISSLLSRLNSPFVIKPLWNSMSLGVKFFPDIKTVIQYVSTHAYQDYIIEEQATGNLYGIEVLINGENRLIQPLVKKCSLNNKDLMPFGHLRYGGAIVSNNVYSKLIKTINKIINELCLQGSVEFELFIDGDNFKIIEINPRISGMSNLSAAISNVNPYTWLIDSNFSKLTHHGYSTKNIVAEFPITGVSKDLLNQYNKEKNIISIQHVTYRNGEENWRCLFRGTSLLSIYKHLVYLQQKNVIKIPSHIINEFENEF